MMLNSPMSQGTLIQAKVNLQVKTGEIVVYSGYLNDNKFNSLKRYQIVHATDGFSSQLTCSEAVILDNESNFEMLICGESSTIGYNWRVAHPGHQSDICLLKCPISNMNKPLGFEGLEEVIHKKILSRLEQMIVTGFHSIAIIKSRPFKCFSSLTVMAKCICIYDDDSYEEVDEEQEYQQSVIFITDSSKERAYGEDVSIGYTYKPSHQMLYLLPSSDPDPSLEAPSCVEVKIQHRGWLQHVSIRCVNALM